MSISTYIIQINQQTIIFKSVSEKLRSDLTMNMILNKGMMLAYTPSKVKAANQDMIDYFISKRNSISFITSKHQVKVNKGIEVEKALDDGYTWREYGQKEIVDAKYHSHTHESDILMKATGKANRMLRAISIECLTLVGMTIRKNKFKDDAKDSLGRSNNKMESLMSEQERDAINNYRSTGNLDQKRIKNYLAEMKDMAEEERKRLMSDGKDVLVNEQQMLEDTV
ncbi:cation-chloride cotransporter 1 [Artemisia annua]|uniref:Cation-chloride cotransporter 1 n=1 Tax=Artemisia annua TaxID=35608 RepID=A0A2U1LK79_ARTAN|nr:cation-chloride cotransporter 1 [Artemisia annua]